jgi:hypothetical protein
VRANELLPRGRLPPLWGGWDDMALEEVLLQKSKSALFDGCNPLKCQDTILDKSVKNHFLQQNPLLTIRDFTASEWLIFS